MQGRRQCASSSLSDIILNCAPAGTQSRPCRQCRMPNPFYQLLHTKLRPESVLCGARILERPYPICSPAPSSHRSPPVSFSDQTVLQHHHVSPTRPSCRCYESFLSRRPASSAVHHPGLGGWKWLTGVCQWYLLPRPVIEVSPDRRCYDNGQRAAGSDDEGVEDRGLLVGCPSQVADGLLEELGVGHVAGYRGFCDVGWEVWLGFKEC